MLPSMAWTDLWLGKWQKSTHLHGQMLDRRPRRGWARRAHAIMGRPRRRQDLLGHGPHAECI